MHFFIGIAFILIFQLIPIPRFRAKLHFFVLSGILLEEEIRIITNYQWIYTTSNCVSSVEKFLYSSYHIEWDLVCPCKEIGERNVIVVEASRYAYLFRQSFKAVEVLLKFLEKIHKLIFHDWKTLWYIAVVAIFLISNINIEAYLFIQ